MPKIEDLTETIEKGVKEYRKLVKPLLPGECQPSILLHPNIPKPMHGQNPRTILGRPWWDKERKAAEARTEGHCLACGVHKSRARFRQWMEGHELYRVNYSKGLVTYLKTVPLCHYCHNFIHSGRMQALLEKGEFKVGQFNAILQHGYDVLLEAGLVKPEPYNGPTAEWGKWRLVLDGRKYAPKFKTPEEWAAAFDRPPGEKARG